MVFHRPMIIRAVYTFSVFLLLMTLVTYTTTHLPLFAFSAVAAFFISSWFYLLAILLTLLPHLYPIYRATLSFLIISA